MSNYEKAYNNKNLTVAGRVKKSFREKRDEQIDQTNNNLKGKSQYKIQIVPMNANGQTTYSTHEGGVFRGYIEELHGHFIPNQEDLSSEDSDKQAIANDLCQIFNTNSPGEGSPVGTNGDYILGETIASAGSVRGGVAGVGRTRHLRGGVHAAAAGNPTAGIGGGGFGTASGLNWGGGGMGLGGKDTPVSLMIKKRKSKKGTFGTQYKFYFPNLAKQRLEKLLTDMNAYVKSRGHDIEFFNFGTIRDIEASMVGGGGRSKGSNHGFGLAIDALVKATGKKEKKGSGVVTKQFTLNGKLTSAIKGNYHARNKVIIKDHALMKVLDDFSKLPKNKDVRWGGRFRRGTKHEIPEVGTLYTMELHHWEIHPDSIEKFWEPWNSQLFTVGITKAPKTTTENLNAMKKLWNMYKKEQQSSNNVASNSQTVETETEALAQAGE